MNNVTSKDVAKHVGVSPSTVSRVLHDNAKISQKTKKKVWKAMEELQYYPNALARGLARQASHTLGLILPNDPEELFVNPFFIEVMRGLSIYAQEHGYNLMYAFSKSEEEEVKFITNYTHSNLVDGVILFTSRQNDQCIAFLKNNSFPFVVIGRPEDTADTYWVDNDNFKAVYDAVNYLIDQGHRQIGFISGPLNYDFSRNRLNGYKQALRNRDLEIDEGMISSGPDFSEASGSECMADILKQKTPDAIVAIDDFLAIGALQKIEQQGLQVAVVGFNNTMKGAFQRPTLTTVDVKPEQLGIFAARILIDRLQKKELKVNHYIVDTQLIERESTRLWRANKKNA